MELRFTLPVTLVFQGCHFTLSLPNYEGGRKNYDNIIGYTAGFVNKKF